MSPLFSGYVKLDGINELLTEAGILSRFTPVRGILFAGQPFQPPENYLRNAELYEEGQTGNYNMLDGRIDNEPPEHEARQFTPPVPERER